MSVIYLSFGPYVVNCVDMYFLTSVYQSQNIAFIDVKRKIKQQNTTCEFYYFIGDSGLGCLILK